MKEFANNKIVTLNDLKQSKNYPNELVENLERRNFKVILELLSNSQRADINIMEPILYAIKNEFDTYEIYTYYGVNLQDNAKLASEIIKEEPELIKDTPISRNEEFILQNVKTNPNIIKYMSENLKENTEFLENLYQLQETDISKKIVKECNIEKLIQNNQELTKDPQFMVEAIKKEVSLIKYANEELKNNYEFIKSACTENNNLIEYVANNTEEFGIEGLTASKKVLINISSKEAITGFEEEQKKVQEELKKKDEKDIESMEELIKKDKRLKRQVVMKTLCKNMDEKYKEKLEQYIKIEDARINKKEQTEKHIIKTEEIAESIENVRKTKIEEEYLAIKEELNNERSPKENEGIDSKENIEEKE